MTMVPWYPPEVVGDDISDKKMCLFMDAISEANGIDKDTLKAVNITIPGAIGHEGNRVLAFFVPSDNIFQDILGKKIYWSIGGENYFIKEVVDCHD